MSVWSVHITVIKIKIICMHSCCDSVENDHCHPKTMEMIYEIWQYWDIHDYWLVLLAALKESYVFIFSYDTRITNKFTTLCEPKTQRQHFRLLIHITGLLHYILCHYSEILAWISKINEYKPFFLTSTSIRNRREKFAIETQISSLLDRCALIVL